MGGDASPWTVTSGQLVQWAGRQEWSRETRRSFRSSALSFYRWAVDAGHVDVNPADKLPRVKPSDPAPRPAPETAYVRALLSAPPRERLMLRLAAELGMRRGEVAQAHADDLTRDLLGWSLVTHGKGGKDRTLPLPDDLAAELRQLGPGYFFPGGQDGHLGAAWVGKLVARLLPGAHTMHALRHKFATDVYSVNRDILVTQELLGHASPVTTRRYVKVPGAELRDTVNAAQRQRRAVA